MIYRLKIAPLLHQIINFGSHLRHCRRTVSFASGWGRRRVFSSRKSPLKNGIGVILHIHTQRFLSPLCCVCFTSLSLSRLLCHFTHASVFNTCKLTFNRKFWEWSLVLWFHFRCIFMGQAVSQDETMDRI